MALYGSVADPSPRLTMAGMRRKEGRQLVSLACGMAALAATVCIISSTQGAAERDLLEAGPDSQPGLWGKVREIFSKVRFEFLALANVSVV